MCSTSSNPGPVRGLSVRSETKLWPYFHVWELCHSTLQNELNTSDCPIFTLVEYVGCARGEASLDGLHVTIRLRFRVYTRKRLQMCEHDHFNGFGHESEKQLARRGFDFAKRCRLTDHADRCLVHIPSFQPTLFGGCVRYEAMHVYFIAFSSWLLETLVQCVPGSMHAYVAKIVKQCHHFRDPATGSTHPRLNSILKLKHYTAEKRVRAVFYWAHVLGTTAHIMPRPIRLNCQCAVSSLQLLLIATRGHRPFVHRRRNRHYL